MKKLAFAFMALFAVSCFVGCSKDSDNEPGKTPGENNDFSFEVQDLTQGSFGVKIIPEDKNQTYYFNLVTKSDFDSYADDAAIQTADYAYMSELAASLGISLDQLLLEALLKGDQEHSYLALTPGTEYVFYCYGISAEGQALTGVNSYSFTTPAAEFMDVNFAITATDITSTSFTLNIQPDNDDCFYYYDVMPASDYVEYCGGSPENVPAFMESYLEALKEEVFSDYTMPQFITEISVRGACSDTESFSGLLPEYTYYAFAIGLANDGSIVTAASVAPIVTSESPKNDYTVDSETVGDVTYSAHITASQSEAFAVLLERQYYFPEGSSDADIINALYAANGNSFSQFLHADNADVSYTRLIPNEDYYLLIFACNVDGSPKLEEGKINLKKVPVKTAEATMSQAEYTITTLNVEKTTARVHVDADSQYSDETFVFSYITKEEYDALKRAVDDNGTYASMDEALQSEMDKYLEASLEIWNQEHPNSQMDMKEFLSRSLMDGAGASCYYDVTGFEPGTAYVIYLFGMKADQTYTTKAFTTEFETVADEACLASYDDFIVMAYDYTDNQQTLYSNWVYVEGSFDKFYGKTFANTDEWADKSVDELRTLLLQESGKSYSGVSYSVTIDWGSTYYFYTVCYDNNGIPTDVYKITHTAPESGEGAGLSGKEVEVEVTTISDASSASAAPLSIKNLSGMTTPIVVERSATPLKSVDASVLDHLMVRRLAKANR